MQIACLRNVGIYVDDDVIAFIHRESFKWAYYVLRSQYLLDLTDPHLADLGFNRLYFGAGFLLKYRTSPVEAQKSGNHSRIIRKIG